MENIEFILLTHPDSSVSVMQFMKHRGFDEKGDPLIVEVNEEEVRNEVAKLVNYPEVVSWRIIDPEKLPLKRTYRKAWRDDGEKVFHDLDHAKKIHVDLARFHRSSVMPSLDIQWMKYFAQGNKDGAESVERKRQQLRDLPREIISKLSSSTSVQDFPDAEKMIFEIVDADIS